MKAQGGLREVGRLLGLGAGAALVHEVCHGPLDLGRNDGERIHLLTHAERNGHVGLHVAELIFQTRDGLQLLLLLEALVTNAFLSLSNFLGVGFQPLAGAGEAATGTFELLAKIVRLLSWRKGRKTFGP